MKKHPKSRSKKSTAPVASEGRILALTGAIEPPGYNVHGARYSAKNHAGQALAPRASGSAQATTVARRPITTIAPPDEKGFAHERPIAVAIPAGAVGKRPATPTDVQQIAAKVRIGADASALVRAVYLTPEQRAVISAALRQYTARYRSRPKKWRRHMRASQDIFRKGIRMPGSFQSRC